MIECSLDWEGFGGCETPYEIKDLLPGEHILQVRAVDEAANADMTPETYTWTVERLAPNTPTGFNVTVEVPYDGGIVSINYYDIGVPGTTMVEELVGGPSLPPGYLIAGGGFFNISTTADFGTPIKLCFTYDPAAFAEFPARILHYDGAEWEDITLSNNPIAGTVCAEPDSFSLYALAAAGESVVPLATIISGPPAISESNSATFEFVVDVPGALAYCSIDGLPETLCTSPITYTMLESLTSHKFEVWSLGPNGEPPEIMPLPYEWEIVLPPDINAARHADRQGRRAP